MAVTRRRWRLENEWSLTNAKLGGVEFVNHPWCATLQHYITVAPYAAPPRQWARFRTWMKARVEQARVFGG